MSKINILGLNFDIAWKDKVRNFKQIEQIFERQSADIFVLPEMFSTGFCMEASEIADESCQTLEWMRKLARLKKAAVVGSVAVKERGDYFNRMYFVKPDGTYEAYDKRHLFSFSGEDKVYRKGERRVVTEYLGVRILLQVCYDLRFPVFSRNLGDYDMAIYVANWPGKRVEAWTHLLKARAIENQAFIFGLNRIGKDGNGLEYVESSYFFAPDGREITRKKGNLVYGELDLDILKAYRKKYRFLEDRDSFYFSDSWPSPSK